MLWRSSGVYSWNALHSAFSGSTLSARKRQVQFCGAALFVSIAPTFLAHPSTWESVMVVVVFLVCLCSFVSAPYGTGWSNPDVEICPAWVVPTTLGRPRWGSFRKRVTCFVHAPLPHEQRVLFLFFFFFFLSPLPDEVSCRSFMRPVGGDGRPPLRHAPPPPSKSPCRVVWARDGLRRRPCPVWWICGER